MNDDEIERLRAVYEANGIHVIIERDIDGSARRKRDEILRRLQKQTFTLIDGHHHTSNSEAYHVQHL